MDNSLEEFRCTCGNPKEVDVTHKTQGPCLHASGLTVHRWNWPYKTPGERELVARWFKKQTKKEVDDHERSEF